MPTTPVLSKDLTQVNTTDGGFFQGNARVAPLQNGGYVVVWEDRSDTYNGGFDAIIGQVYDASGQKVGGEVYLGPGNVGHEEEPAVTTLSNGNIAVAFTGSSADQIVVRIFDPTLAFVRQDTIDLFDGLSNPSITALAGGAYAVSFTRTTLDFEDEVDGRIFSPTGTPGTPMEIGGLGDVGGNDDQNQAELATLANGNFIAVYQDESNSGDIYFAIRTAAGVPVVASHIAASTAGEIEPDVAALTGGGFAIVWIDSAIDGSDTGIAVAIAPTDGSSTGSRILVNTTTAGFQTQARVTALADGGFVVIWEDDNAGVVRGQRFDHGGSKIGSEFTLNSTVTIFEDAPLDVVLLADGRLAFVGDRFDGIDFDVVTSIWDPRGGPTGVAINPTVASIAEDVSTAAPIKVADIAITDDGDGTNLLTPIGADAAFFEIVGTELFLKAGAALDFETKQNYSVAVQVDDPAVGTTLEATSATYTLTVSNVSPETIIGTAVSDILTGGSDADNFVFNTALNKKTNVDTIVGFDVAADAIHLDNDIFKKLKQEGPLKKKYFEVGKKADDKDDFIVYNKKTGELSYDKNGDGKGGAVLFAQLDDHLKLKADDFLVI